MARHDSAVRAIRLVLEGIAEARLVVSAPVVAGLAVALDPELDATRPWTVAWPSYALCLGRSRECTLDVIRMSAMLRK